ncbi:beta-lactamase [Microscilla marina ATCC 23134]|uniref:Beta-lactamase n=2 Tax=Microscilla marina TaxID=1027 RepID=A1ZVC7_MICM2|nr:beta-lactamase [Microscilla marina ATCC 23134]
MVYLISVTQAQTLKEWKRTVVPEFKKLAKEHSWVGASLCLTQNGQVVDFRTAGYMDRENKRLNTKRTIFNWGSITKTITAVCIMRLRDENKLKLEDPVTKHIPEFRWLRSDSIGVDIETVTIKHLLTHTSGIDLRKNWVFYNDFADKHHRPLRWKQIAAILPYCKLKRIPGSKFEYSNFGFILLGRVVENVMREPYTSYVYKNIFMPLGMNTAHFGISPPHIKALRSISYYQSGKDATIKRAERIKHHNYGIGNPVGGLYASIDDMTKYIMFLAGTSDAKLQQKYNLVLKNETIGEMIKGEVYLRKPRDFHSKIGLGIYSTEYKGQKVNYHDGVQFGFLSFMFLDRKDNVGVLMVTNTQTRKILRQFYRTAQSPINGQFFLRWTPSAKKKK